MRTWRRGYNRRKFVVLRRRMDVTLRRICEEFFDESTTSWWRRRFVVCPLGSLFPIHSINRTTGEVRDFRGLFTPSLHLQENTEFLAYSLASDCLTAERLNNVWNAVEASRFAESEDDLWGTNLHIDAVPHANHDSRLIFLSRFLANNHHFSRFLAWIIEFSRSRQGYYIAK